MRGLFGAVAAAIFLLSACGGGGGASSNASEAPTPAVSPQVLSYALQGRLSGLAPDVKLNLALNGQTAITLTADGEFRLPNRLASGSAFALTLTLAPGSLSQSCVVENGSGVINAADYTNVNIICTPKSYKLGGEVAGLLGNGLTLTSGGSRLVITSNGRFAFSSPVSSGTAYQVSISEQPLKPTQTCTVNSGQGVVLHSDIADVSIVCSTNSYRLGGTVEGLLGTGLVLQNNAADDLVPKGNGFFSFSQAVASGAGYAVTVRQQPASPRQTCSVIDGRGKGLVDDRDVNSVSVVCATNSYKIGGTVTGLQGTLVLQNNDGDDLLVTRDGKVTFDKPVASGASYAITIKRQPEDALLNCSLNASGARGDVIDSDLPLAFNVNCSRRVVRLGVTVTGLKGQGLILDSAGNGKLEVSTDGRYWFDRPLVDGSDYQVLVDRQPISPAQTCTVSNGSGTVRGADVSAPVVTCTAWSSTYMAATSQTHDMLHLYNLDPETGTLRPAASASAGRRPGSLVVSPDRRFIYVGNSDSNDIYTFEYDAAKNQLRQVARTPTLSVKNLQDLAITPDGRYLYAIGFDSLTVGKFAIDSSSGVPAEFDKSIPGSSPAGVGHGLVVDSSGRFLYAGRGAGITPYSIDAQTGRLSEVLSGTSILGAVGPFGLLPSGKLMFANSANGPSGISIDSSNGGLMSRVPRNGAVYDGFATALAVSRRGRFLAYAAQSNGVQSAPVFLAGIDQTTGALSGSLEGRNVSGYVSAIAFDPQEKFAFVAGLTADRIYVFAINPATNTLSGVGEAFSQSPSALQVFELDPRSESLAARRRAKSR